ncbi:MAG: class I SAM-dependent methyltransferase [Myxococcota bacterium]
MDPRDRFSATVDDYVRYRPDYPDAFFDWLRDAHGLAPKSRILEVGCGTGIATRQLMERGYDVVATDPNEAMLTAARKHGGTFVCADAETLDVQGEFSLVVGGQAFHWFDLARALPRFAELAPRAVAFWNLRDDHHPSMAAYDALLRKRCSEYASVGAEPRARAVQAQVAAADLKVARFPHAQALSLDAFRGRVWSSSYVRHSVEDPDRFNAELDRLFETHAEDGVFRMRYQTRALSFALTDWAKDP